MLVAAGLAWLLPPRESPPLDRLPALGAVDFVRRPLGGAARGNQVRPALVLRSGESRSCTARVPPGTSLQFAVAVEGAGGRSGLALEVRVDGQAVLERTLTPEAARHFSSFSVPVKAGSRRRVELAGRILPPGGGATEGAAGRIVLGSVRLARGAARAPGRVLVWVSQDTVRADHVGAYGYDRATTPSFDRRVARGVLFEEAVATAPWTLPSLVSQFTGRYPSRHGAVLDDRSRERRYPTIFQVLAGQGFTVLGVTANRFVSRDFGTADGFDVLSFTPAEAGSVTRLALRQLDEDWQGGDLALFVHYMDPHFPYLPRAPFRQRFATPYRGAVDGRNFTRLAPGRARPEEVAHVESLYDAELAYGDRQIESLLEALERRGLLAKAVVVYSADHGEGFLEHGKWLHASTVYRELLHVPLALWAPGLRARRVAEPVSLVDLAPTLLDLLGIPAPPSVEGRSLRPALEGGRPSGRPMFAETEETTERAHRKLAVRAGWLKYISTSPVAGHPGPSREELYDLRADPGERAPLSLARAGALRRLARAYQAGSGRATGRRVLLSPRERDALRALGYVH